MKPIIFSTEMVQAILQNRKTQTRRVLKPKVDAEYKGDSSHGHGGYDSAGNFHVLQPPAYYGDILWVRETFCRELGRYYYRADGEAICSPSTSLGGIGGQTFTEIVPKWKPSIHMPREAARLFLRVTDVRVERLIEISGEDVLAEGIAATHDERGELSSYIDLWDSLNYKRGYGWDTNPYVWVYEFEVIDHE